MSRLHKTSTSSMTRDSWLSQRRQGIGGSDAATIIGLNPYSSLYALWADKKGLLPEQEDNEAMRQGRDLEPYVAQRFEEYMAELGTPKVTNRVNAILKNPAYPFAIANIDRRIKGESAGLECKITSSLNTKLYRNGEYPERFLCQCLHYLAVTGWQRWYLAIMIANRELKIYTIERSDWEADITELMAAEREFWETYILTNTPPPTDGTESSGIALSHVFLRSEEGLACDLSEKEGVISELLAVKATIKSMEEQAEALEQEIKASMRDAERGEAGRFLVTWKTQSRDLLSKDMLLRLYPNINLDSVQKTSTSRVFKIKEVS